MAKKRNLGHVEQRAFVEHIKAIKKAGTNAFWRKSHIRMPCGGASHRRLYHGRRSGRRRRPSTSLTGLQGRNSSGCEENQGDESLGAWKNYGGAKTWPAPRQGAGRMTRNGTHRWMQCSTPVIIKSPNRRTDDTAAIEMVHSALSVDRLADHASVDVDSTAAACLFVLTLSFTRFL